MLQSHKHAILSGIMAVFLTGTLVITATVIDNPNISFDLRKFASGDNWMNEPTLTVNSVKTTVNPTTGTAHSTVSYTQGEVTNTIDTNATVNSSTGNRQANTTVTNTQGDIVINRSSTDTMNGSGQLTTTHTTDTRTDANGKTNTFDTTVNVNPKTGKHTETTTQNGVTITQNGQYVNGYNPNDSSTQPPLTTSQSTSSTPQCGIGYKLNSSTNQCDPDMSPDRIDQLTSNCNNTSGMHYDQETGNCIPFASPTNAPRTICPSGSSYNNSTNTCDKVVATTEKTDNGTIHNTTIVSTDPTTHNIVNAQTSTNPTSNLNPNVTYKLECQPGFIPSSDNLHCVQSPASSPTTNALGCNLHCSSNETCKKISGNLERPLYQCVSSTPPTSPPPTYVASLKLCGTNQDCINNLNQLFYGAGNTINSITFGTASNYTNAFQGNYMAWQQAGYSSSDAYIKDCVAKNGVGASYACMKQGTALSDAATTASTQLGIVATAEGAAAYTGATALYGGVTTAVTAASVPSTSLVGAISAGVGNATPGIYLASNLLNTGHAYSNAIGACSSDSHSAECYKSVEDSVVGTIFTGAAVNTVNAQAAVDAALSSGSKLQLVAANEQLSQATATQALLAYPSAAFAGRDAYNNCKDGLSTNCVTSGLGLASSLLAIGYGAKDINSTYLGGAENVNADTNTSVLSKPNADTISGIIDSSVNTGNSLSPIITKPVGLATNNLTTTSVNPGVKITTTLNSTNPVTYTSNPATSYGYGYSYDLVTQ